MTRASRVSGARLPVIVALILSLVPWTHLRADDSDESLKIAPSPYRGRVVELLTDTPLAGTLIVFVWPRRDDANPGAPHRTFALRETLTDANGHFSIDASDIEATAPATALAPRMLAWKPGYVSLPREYGERFGVPVAWLAQRNGVIGLKPVSGFEERIMAFNVAFMNVEKRQSSQRSRELPLFMQMGRDEVAFFDKHATEIEEQLRKSP